jgi:ABC-type glutathione transport system ATPase component
VSLMNAFVSHLRRLVEEKGGQLILASHAPELWKEFTDSQTIQLGTLSRGETSHE